MTRRGTEWARQQGGRRSGDGDEKDDQGSSDEEVEMDEKDDRWAGRR